MECTYRRRYEATNRHIEMLNKKLEAIGVGEQHSTRLKPLRPSEERHGGHPTRRTNVCFRSLST